MKKLFVAALIASVATNLVHGPYSLAQGGNSQNSNVQNDVRGGANAAGHGPVAADEVSQLRKQKLNQKKLNEAKAAKAKAAAAAAAASGKPAAPSKTGSNTKSNLRATTPVKPAQNNLNLSAPAAQPRVMVPSYNNMYAPATTSAAPAVRSRVSTASKDATPSPWSFSYTTYNAIGLSGLENASKNPDDYEVLATDRVYLGYKLTDNVSLGVLAEFDHSWFGNPNRAQSNQVVVAGVPQFQQPGSAYFGDTALILSDSKLAKLKGDVTMDGYIRYYIPTSEASQLSGTYGYTRASLGFTKSVGIVDFHFSEQVRYYFQQYQTSYALRSSDNMPIQNYNYRVFSLLDTGVNITKKLTFTVETGFENREYYGDDNLATQRPVTEDFQYILNPDLTYSFNKTFALSVGVWDETSLLGRTTPYSPFDALQNGVEGYLQGKVSF